MTGRRDTLHKAAVTGCAAILAACAGAAVAEGIRLAGEGRLWLAAVAGLGAAVLVAMALLAILDWERGY